jgi:hypothetical protein
MDGPRSGGWDSPTERLDQPVDAAWGVPNDDVQEVESAKETQRAIQDDFKSSPNIQDVPRRRPDQVTEIPDQVDKIPDQVDSGYKREEAARQDLHILVDALDKVTRQLKELTDTLEQHLAEGVAPSPDVEEQLHLAKQIAPEISQLKDAVTELPERRLNQEPDLAFSATAQMTAVMSEVGYAKKQFPVTRMWKKIWATLKTAAPRLWSLISHLVKVKEWSVIGEVGTGVLGLAKASISVTFG